MSSEVPQCNTLLQQYSKSALIRSIEQGLFYDVSFEVQSAEKLQKFKGFKSFFATQSTKFYKMLIHQEFDVDCKDDSSLNDPMMSDCVRIFDLTPEIFSFLQKLFYGSFDIRINTENVIGIIKAAETYKIPYLRDCCLEYLLQIDFQIYSSSFLYLLHQTQIHKLENGYIQIIDCLPPLYTVEQFEQFFCDTNKVLFCKLCVEIVIYLLFLAQKFDVIEQEYKWKLCVFWAQNNAINSTMIAQKMQCFVEHFNFLEMDWSFFIQNVYNLNVLSTKHLIRILSHYTTEHSRIMLSRDWKKRLFLPTTKFMKFIQSQKLFVEKIQKNENIEMSEDDIIARLVSFMKFNTKSIDNKKKEPNLYNSWDEYFEKNRQNQQKNKSFLNADESKEKYEAIYEEKQTEIVRSAAVESLSLDLCQSIEHNLSLIISDPSLNDVKFRLNNNVIYYGIRGLFAMHSKVFCAMLFSSNFMESNKQNVVYLDNVDPDTFKWIQSYLYGLTSATITSNNVVNIYMFSDKYLMSDLRGFALKFICWMNIQQKASDFLSIIHDLHKYQHEAFWGLFIAQIKEENVTFSEKECEIIVKHKSFNVLSADIIKPFLFESGLFKCYSTETFWSIIVKWCSPQKQLKTDSFCKKRLKPFLSFFDLYGMDLTLLNSDEFFVLIMNVKSYKKIFEKIRKQKSRNTLWPKHKFEDILNNSLIVVLPFDIINDLIFNFSYHNISQELLWNGCIRWCLAQTSTQETLNQKLKPFLKKNFIFHKMSIQYFEDNVVSINILSEFQVMSVYEGFCGYYGVNHTINTDNVIKLCLGANKHSLRKLELTCLKYVAAIDVVKKCTKFLKIILTLFKSSKITNFISRMSTYLSENTWTKSVCWCIVKNHKYFNMLTVELIELLLFKSNQFKEFTQEQMWEFCLNWSDANSNDSIQRNEKLRKFICYFRFEYMIISFFRAKVEKLNVLTDSETTVINHQFVDRLLDIIDEKNNKIKEKNQKINKHEHTIECQVSTIYDQNITIERQYTVIQNQETAIQNQESVIQLIQNQETSIRTKNKTIEELMQEFENGYH